MNEVISNLLKILLISMLMIPASCGSHKKNSDEQSDTLKRYTISLEESVTYGNILVRIPDVDGDSVNEYHSAYCSYFLDGFGEQEITSKPNDHYTEIIRLLILKEYSHPILIKFIKPINKQPHIIFKQTDGNSNYVGNITTKVYEVIDDQLFDQMKDFYLDNNIASIPANSEYNYYSSGTEYLLETVINGKYQCLVRIAPDMMVKAWDSAENEEVLIKFFQKLFEVTENTANTSDYLRYYMHSINDALKAKSIKPAK
jgi:hypothetical protein